MVDDFVDVCSDCRREKKICVSDLDVGFHFHWVDDYYLIDVVSFFEGCQFVLFSMVYGGLQREC